MIKINLTPELELESTYWYLPSVAIILVVAACGFFYAEYVVSDMRAQQITMDNDSREFVEKLAKIQSDVSRFAAIDESVKSRKQKLKILQDITGKKLERFKPVLIMDVLQVIKPAGVWFRSLEITNRGADVSIDGGSFDNIILAEFLTNIKVTASQKISISDIRTQIYFADMDFRFSRQATGDDLFRDIGSHYRFQLTFKIKNLSEKAPTNPADPKKITMNLLDELGEVSL